MKWPTKCPDCRSNISKQDVERGNCPCGWKPEEKPEFLVSKCMKCGSTLVYKQVATQHRVDRGGGNFDFWYQVKGWICYDCCPEDQKNPLHWTQEQIMNKGFNTPQAIAKAKEMGLSGVFESLQRRYGGKQKVSETGAG